MAAARLSTKQYSTLGTLRQPATSASASDTGESTTATPSPSKSGTKLQSGSSVNPAQKRSQLEMTLHLHMRAAGIPDPMTEYRFDPKRRWRADFAWPEQMLMVEVEGGVWSNGRHSRGTGFIADCSKYNEAALGGWRVLRVAGDHIRTGEALEWIRRALA